MQTPDVHRVGVEGSVLGVEGSGVEGSVLGCQYRVRITYFRGLTPLD